MATVQVRVKPPEKRAYTQAARLSGVSVSAWVRERLRRAATDELRAAGKPVPFLTET